MQFDFTFDSSLVIGIFRIYWLSVELLSPTNQLDCGIASSDRNTLPGCEKDTRDMATHFSLMRFSSRLMASNVTSGEPQIKLVKSLMCFFKIGEMLRLPSDSSDEF